MFKTQFAYCPLLTDSWHKSCVPKRSVRGHNPRLHLAGGSWIDQVPDETGDADDAQDAGGRDGEAEGVHQGNEAR